MLLLSCEMSVDRSQVGADIVKRALSYPLKLIAKNAGVNGSVVSEKVGGVLERNHCCWFMYKDHQLEA